ncbi:hypothetical protein [Caproiciproducens sp. CPB-2]|uniref:hypothetical protein n=1 Tax=Caproiciproducens sp. CPB-2 TaxID=3030017 RepID=UPI0023D9EEB3|nr:hypothetical protein [Caproiciproducens sp. CPB-2]MDF1493357.1 hypothetical protein [Caproiciproducens sp. CPB-2]
MFYTVCYRRYDGSAQNSAVLTEVRRGYLTTRKSKSGKTGGCLAGMEFAVRYKIGPGKFSWRMTSGKTVLQKAYRQKYGYYILTRNGAGETVGKARFGRDHAWLQTAYYSGNTARPEAVLKPNEGNDGLVLLRLVPETGRYARVELFPSESCGATARQSLVNAIAGEPEIYAETDGGGFFYCPLKETERRMAVMKDLSAGKESVIPEWPGPDDKKEEAVPFVYIENDRPAPEKPAEEVAAVPFPAASVPAEPDYAADHELYSTEELPALPAPPVRYTVAGKGLNGGPRVSDDLPLRVERGTKRIVISAEESYTYFGKVIDGLRQGRGRTQMQNGCTAYEGNYLNDKRDGFGAYYYKSGKICYVGGWKANKRDGVGVSYSSRDGSIFVGRWKDNIPTGSGAAFDAQGRLIYTGEWKDGLRHGHGTEYNQDGEIVFTGEFREDRYYSGYKRI